MTQKRSAKTNGAAELLPAVRIVKIAHPLKARKPPRRISKLPHALALGASKPPKKG